MSGRLNLFDIFVSLKSQTTSRKRDNNENIEPIYPNYSSLKKEIIKVSYN